MLYKTKVFVRVIVLLYPKPSQLPYCRLQSENVKAHKRHQRTWNNYACLEFGVDFVLNRPQYKFQLDEKHQRAFIVTLFEKISRRAKVTHS